MNRGGITPSDRAMRYQIRQLHDQLVSDRQQEINRAVGYRHGGNEHMAGYHAGLADGRNAAIKKLGALIREYPVPRDAELALQANGGQ